MVMDRWPPPWGQEPVSQTPPLNDDAAVVGGEWVVGHDLPRPPRLVAWANRSRTARWREVGSPRLVVVVGFVAAIVLVAVAM